MMAAHRGGGPGAVRGHVTSTVTAPETHAPREPCRDEHDPDEAARDREPARDAAAQATSGSSWALISAATISGTVAGVAYQIALSTRNTSRGDQERLRAPSSHVYPAAAC